MLIPCFSELLDSVSDGFFIVAGHALPPTKRLVDLLSVKVRFELNMWKIRQALFLLPSVAQATIQV